MSITVSSLGISGVATGQTGVGMSTPLLLVEVAPEIDTIRDAILTCAQKPRRVGLIYRTETTTKNCKTEKLKSKRRYVRSNSKSLGNHVVSSEEEKERLQWEGFAEKGFKSGMKERVGDEKLIIITNKRNC